MNRTPQAMPEESDIDTSLLNTLLDDTDRTVSQMLQSIVPPTVAGQIPDSTAAAGISSTLSGSAHVDAMSSFTVRPTGAPVTSYGETVMQSVRDRQVARDQLERLRGLPGEIARAVAVSPSPDVWVRRADAVASMIEQLAEEEMRRVNAIHRALLQ